MKFNFRAPFLKLQGIRMNGDTTQGESRSQISFLLALFLIEIALLFILLLIYGLPSQIPMQVASWLAFIGILIIPGYLLTSIFSYYHPFEFLERLALSLPIGLAAFSIPGLIVMVLHRAYSELLLSWLVTTALIFLASLIFQFAKRKSAFPKIKAWTVDEIVLVIILASAFIAVLPILNSLSVDGDLLTYISSLADNVAGKPFALVDPMFGTNLTPGLRMMFNQLIPLMTLWARLSKIDALNLSVYASRSMFALWGLLAVFFLGKAVGNGNRRIGLLAACVQMLIYLAAPFFKSSNDSTFYFLRTNADKFTVTITMLPTAFGLAIYYIRHGKRDIWIAAVLAAFAVSGIHPLISSMLALGLAGFGGVHLLLNLRSKVAWVRVSLTAIIAVVAMIIPLVLLVLSFSELPMAPTFPSSFDGWKIHFVQAPGLPFIHLPNLEWGGTIPDLSTAKPEDANTNTDPFLVWRYVDNTPLQKFLVFSVNRYISNPSIILDPPYFLALFLSLFLIWRLKSNLGMQFALGVILADIFVLFNPFILPLLGKLTMPWILYRLAWMVPYAVIITIFSLSVCNWIAKMIGYLVRSQFISKLIDAWLPISLFLIAGVLLSGFIRANLREIQNTSASVSPFPQPKQLLAALSRFASDKAIMVAADQALSVSIPAYVSNANIIGHRIFNISEFFPASQQDIALKREIDQYYLFNTSYLTENSIRILLDYGVNYIAIRTDSNLNCQLRLANYWFDWVLDDGDYSLYAVIHKPGVTDTIRGLTALEANQPDQAEAYFQSALKNGNPDRLAQAGLAMVYRTHGQINQALDLWQAIASAIPVAPVYDQIGRISQDLNNTDASQTAYEQAVKLSPDVNTYHWQLGDIYANQGQINSAEDEYHLAVKSIADETDQLALIGDHWQLQSRYDLAETYYRQAIKIRDSLELQTRLATSLQQQGLYTDAEKILDNARHDYPGSDDTLVSQAILMSTQAKYDQAVELYNQKIWLQDLKIQDDTLSRIGKIRVLLDANRWDDAEKEILSLLQNNPYDMLTYVITANLMIQKGDTNTAIAALDKALSLDPNDIETSLSLYNLSHSVPEDDEFSNLLTNVSSYTDNQLPLFIILGKQLQNLGETKLAINAFQVSLDMLEKSKDIYIHWEGSSIDPMLANNNKVGQLKAMSYSMLGIGYEDLGLIDNAMTAFQEAAAVDPTNITYLLSLGNAYDRRNNTTAAEAIYKKIIELDPTRLEGYTSLAEMYQKQGKVDLATEYLHKAMTAFQSQTVQSQDAEIQLGQELVQNSSMMFGILYGSEPTSGQLMSDLMMTNHLTSLPDLIQILEAQSQPDDVLALALVYERTQQYDAGIKFIQEQISQGEKNNLSSSTLVDYYNTLGALLFDQGNYKMAGVAYNHGLTLDSQSSTSKIGSIKVQIQTGDLANARREIDDTLANSKNSIDMQLSVANLLSTLGDLQRSVKILEDVVGSQPGNTSALGALANANLHLNHLDAAGSMYQKVLQITPGDASAYIGLAGVQMIQGKLGDAVANLQSAISVDHTSLDAYLSLGQILMQRAQYQKAQEFFQQAALISPWNTDAALGLANSYRSLGDINKAEEILKQASEQNQLSGEPLLSLADIYQEQGQPQQAETALLDAVARPESTLEARKALASYYQQQNKSDQALEQLKLAMQEFPSSSEPMALYAEQLLQLGHTDEAQQWLKNAQQVSQPSAVGYRLMATAYQELGQTDQATAMIEQAISLEPGNWENLVEKATIQQNSGDLSSALLTLQTATSLAPLQGQVWQSLGELESTMHQQQAAETAWKQAIEVDPSFLPPYSLLVGLYQKIGNPELAKSTLSSARAAAPGSYLVDLYTAQFEQAQGDLQTAQSTIQQAVQKAPGSPTPYEVFGSILALQLRYGEALTLYHEAYKKFPTEINISIVFANVYRQLGDIGNAEAILQKASKLNPLSVEPLLSLADIYQEQGQPDQAEATLLEAEKRPASTLEARLTLSSFYQKRGQADLVLAHLQLAMQKFPSSPEPLALYAEQLYQLGRTDEAQQWLKKAQQVSQPSAQGYRLMAATYKELGQTDQASAMIEQAISLEPGDWENLVQKAAIQQDSGDLASALLTLQTATSLAPLQGQVWQSLGELQSTMQQPQAAETAWKQAIQVDPSFLPPYSLLVGLYQKNGNLDVARSTLSSARAAAPGSYLVDLYIAQFEQAQGDLQAAQTTIQQAIQKAPGSPTPYQNLYSILLQKQDFTQAKNYLLKAIAAEPGNVILLNSLSGLNYIMYEPFYSEPITWDNGTQSATLPQMIYDLQQLSIELSGSSSWRTSLGILEGFYGNRDQIAGESSYVRSQIELKSQATKQVANRVANIEDITFRMYTQNQNQFISNGVQVEPQTIFWPSSQSGNTNIGSNMVFFSLDRRQLHVAY
jgi:tetratricopeptide (TPR) repeat protein